MAYDTFSDADPQKSADRESADQANQPETLASAPSAPGQGWLGGWRGLALGLGLGAAIATIGIQLSSGSRTAAPSATPAVVLPGQSVTVAAATLSRVTQSVNVTGSVAAFDLLPISAQASGLQIQQVLVSEGQTVTAGQALAVLDSSVLTSQLNQARADVASAQAVVQQKRATLAQEQATQAQADADLRRYRTLAQAGAISQQDLDSYVTAAKTAQASANVAQADIASATADVQSKQAQIQQLQTQIAQTVVRAPTSGMIAEQIARVGNVTGSEKLFSLIRDGALELQAKVPETEMPPVKVGAIAQITSDADPRIQLQGRVREISPLVDAQSRQATVKIDLPASSFLRSGMFLKAAITIQSSQALTVPATAVLPQADGHSIVYVLGNGDTVHAQPVEVGTRQDSTDPNQAKIAIRSGLNPGDRVVVAGAGYIKDGDRVTIVQP